MGKQPFRRRWVVLFKVSSDTGEREGETQRVRGSDSRLRLNERWQLDTVLRTLAAKMNGFISLADEPGERESLIKFLLY